MSYKCSSPRLNAQAQQIKILEHHRYVSAIDIHIRETKGNIQETLESHSAEIHFLSSARAKCIPSGTRFHLQSHAPGSKRRAFQLRGKEETIDRKHVSISSVDFEEMLKKAVLVPLFK